MKSFKFYFMMLVISISASCVLAQDELFEQEQVASQDDCVPAKLITLYDSVANKELDQDIRLIYNFGFEYFKNKSYNEALPYLWKAFIKDDGKYARAAIRKIAEIYFNQGKVDSTLLSCYRGLERFDEAILHHYAGLLQNKLGKFRCAIPHFEKLVNTDSTNKEYLKTLAFLYFKDGNEKAIFIQEKLVKLNPGNSDDANTLAQYVKNFIGEGDEYIKHLESAANNDPENMDLKQRLAEAALNFGDYDKTQQVITKVIEKKPSVKAYMLRAHAFEGLNKHTQAITDYKKVLEFEATNAEVMVDIATSYKILNDFASAKQWVNKALKAKPGFGLAYIVMGEVYESAVSYCQSQRGGKPKYEDKLVYKKALNEFVKALNDPAYASRAKRKQEAVQPLIPTKEDEFMHKTDKIEFDCYTSWIE